MARRFVWAITIVGICAARMSGAQGAKSVWSGVYTEAQATTGETLFGDYCANCHGDDLAGVEEAPALAGGPFGQRWDGATLKKLYDRMEEMPPKEPKRLTAKQYADILAFLLYANKYPSGATVLASDRAVLADITISSVRPK